MYHPTALGFGSLLFQILNRFVCCKTGVAVQSRGGQNFIAIDYNSLELMQPLGYIDTALVQAPYAYGDPKKDISRGATLGQAHLVAFVKDYALDLLRIISRIHKQGVCHCDITNDNVVFDQETRKCTLRGFQQSKHMTKPGSNSPVCPLETVCPLANNIIAAMHPGTDGFRAPERLCAVHVLPKHSPDYQPADERTEDHIVNVVREFGLGSGGLNYGIDVWGAGVVLMHVATGTHPLGSKSPGHEHTTLRTNVPRTHGSVWSPGTKSDITLAQAALKAEKSKVGKWTQAHLEYLGYSLPELAEQGFFGLLDAMMQYSPHSRKSASALLDHRFFEEEGQDEGDEDGQ